MKRYVVPILLLVGCVVLFGFNLGDLGLLKGDENYYFSSGRRMIREGDWITPRYHHHIRFEKPVLYYWIVALFFKLFGVSWTIARLTSVIFGGLTVLLTYLLSLRLLPKRAAYLSPIVLATSFLFFRYSRIAVIDMTFLFLITLCLFLFIKGGREDKKKYLILSFVPLGLSVLAKGPLGLIIVGIIIVFYLAMTKKMYFLKGIHLVLGIFILLLIVLPWPTLMYNTHGPEYLTHLWEVETVDKVVGSVVKLENVNNIPWFAIKYIGYYIPVIIFTFAPWSLLLTFALFKKLRTNREEDRIFILSWFWCIFIFFTIASFKHTHYMLLLSPPMAMIIAGFFTSAKKGSVFQKAPVIITAITIVIFVSLTGFILPALDDGTLKMFSLKLSSEMQKQDEEIGIASSNFNLKKIGIFLNNLVSTTDELGGDDLAQYRLINKDYIVPFLESKERVYCLITKTDYLHSVPKELQKRLYVLEKNLMWKKFNLKEYLPLMAKRDWDSLKEEAYLISNRR
ncbi:glycosyltransferase family 39 protein [Omnitrophica bacterium]|nr:glycosyltransferase family 39 protein [Candidatus Omnitrophota bacterium]